MVLIFKLPLMSVFHTTQYSRGKKNLSIVQQELTVVKIKLNNKGMPSREEH
jgi:hypothetical protein